MGIHKAIHGHHLWLVKFRSGTQDEMSVFSDLFFHADCLIKLTGSLKRSKYVADTLISHFRLARFHDNIL